MTWLRALWCAWVGHDMAIFDWPADAFMVPGQCIEVPTVNLVSYVRTPGSWTDIRVLERHYCRRCLWVASSQYFRHVAREATRKCT